MISLTDAEALSQLLAGELGPTAADVLRARLEVEPELLAMWTVLSSLPTRLAQLPDVEMSTELEQSVRSALAHPPQAQSPESELPRRPRWAEAGLALAVAAGFLFVAVRAVGPQPAGVEPAPQQGVESAHQGDPVAEGVGTPSVPRSAEPGPLVTMFDPDLFPPPRRGTHRPQRYQRPPPGGHWQYQAVDLARRKDCPGSLLAVQSGMRQSIDHATLYKGAWYCFNDTHQRKLERASAAIWPDFEPMLPHFDALEFRLGAWTQDELMVEVVDDLIGAPTVADQVAKDVQLEVLAAEGLSREHARLTEAGLPIDPKLVDAWARRVRITRFALGSRAGTVLAEHRPELVPELERLYAAATTPRTTAAGTVIPLPAAVVDAMGGLR